MSTDPSVDPRLQIIGVGQNLDLRTTVAEGVVPERLVFTNINSFNITTSDNVNHVVKFDEVINLTIPIIPPAGNTPEEKWNNYRGIKFVDRNIDVLYDFLNMMSQDKNHWSKYFIAWKCDEPEGKELLIVETPPKIEEVTDSVDKLTIEETSGPKGKEPMN